MKTPTPAELRAADATIFATGKGLNGNIHVATVLSTELHLDEVRAYLVERIQSIQDELENETVNDLQETYWTNELNKAQRALDFLTKCPPFKPTSSRTI